MSKECYTEGHEDCNLAFKTYYRYASVHNYTKTECDGWVTQLIVALDYFCALEPVCGKSTRSVIVMYYNPFPTPTSTSLPAFSLGIA